MPDGCQSDEVFKLPGKRLKASMLQHCKYESVIATYPSPVFTSMPVCYEMAHEIAIGFQMFSCLSTTSLEFHAFTETCLFTDTV